MTTTEDLLWLGLSPSKAAETLKNAKLCETIGSIIKIVKESGVTGELSKQKGTLLYQLSTKIKPQCASNIPLVVKYIMSEDIKNELQLSAAIEYLLSHAVKLIDVNEFEKSCGIGVVVTPDEIEDTVTEVVSKCKDQLIKERYSFNIGKLLGEVRSRLPWGDGAYIKKEVDLRILEILGPKTADDLAPKKKEKKTEKKPDTKSNAKKDDKAKTEEVAEFDGAETMDELLKTRAHFHKVGENYKTDGYVTTPKTAELLKKHVAAVGGKVMTRFPPEPNGVLHIGHAKAININFGYAKAMDGLCYLRFDDTNPEKEEEKFFTAIADMVNWLGYEPYKVTHSSDYFDQLYKWAIELIRKGLAYVCHQKVEEMRGFEVQMSPWRDRPIEESLQLFEV
ncbi:unnamed protein product [Caenorhabditis bovis]|uniref:Glutaminyl-tRNA synthetase n=1 Tax=Caenorhabditis bovis TaxID=2654633 RepID=A0A8S1F1H2_9PELO|nr:unnamed protein product [Caenorhabditis bovis]